jgi:hypothetical protein
MTTTNIRDSQPVYEGQIHAYSLVSLKSVFSGVLISMLAYMVLSSLGTGIFGLTASHIMEKGDTGSGMVTAEGLWMGASAIIALFLGGYFATRFSNITHRQVGACQALVTAAVFFYVLLNVPSSTFGSFNDVTAYLTHPNAINEADNAAKSIGDTGLLIFATLVIGIVASVLGGIEGVIGNRKRPFRYASVETKRSTALPIAS